LGTEIFDLTGNAALVILGLGTRFTLAIALTLKVIKLGLEGTDCRLSLSKGRRVNSVLTKILKVILGIADLLLEALARL